jgi:hypothetical protein
LADHGPLFYCRQLLIGDAVTGERPFDRDVVDVLLGDRWGSVGSVSMSSHAIGGGHPRVPASYLEASAAAHCSTVFSGGPVVSSRA